MGIWNPTPMPQSGEMVMGVVMEGGTWGSFPSYDRSPRPMELPMVIST